jgi:hypothetical protein
MQFGFIRLAPSVHCSGLENHFHFSYNEVAIDVYLSREGKGKYR